MFSQTIRYLVCSLIGVATFLLGLGVLLFQAASVTGAASNYRVHVTWLSVLSDVMWPPSHLPFLLLLGVFLLALFTLLIFFRAPRSVGVVVLFVQAGVAYFCDGWLGLFFIRREFSVYHFNMDGEKLGEYWFSFEAIGVWTLAAAALAIIRIFAGKHLSETQAGLRPF